MRVEILLEASGRSNRLACLLHADGGSPQAAEVLRLAPQSSLHAWRYTATAEGEGSDASVFSTGVEVLRILGTIRKGKGRLLRTRGGTPLRVTGSTPVSSSSPQARRYAGAPGYGTIIHPVFSACAEVHRCPPGPRAGRRRLLRMRGGTPEPPALMQASPRCSPWAWRYTAERDEMKKRMRVFFTHVEVSRAAGFCHRLTVRLLHACGGIPARRYNADNGILSSPHARRLSTEGTGARRGEEFSPHARRYPDVLPSHVGGGEVFSIRGGIPVRVGHTPRTPPVFLHARGGIPP